MTRLYLAVASSRRFVASARSASSIRLRAISGVSWAARKSERTRATTCMRWTSEVYFDLTENGPAGQAVDAADERLFGPFVEQVGADEAQADGTVAAEVVADARVDQRVARLLARG